MTQKEWNFSEMKRKLKEEEVKFVIEKKTLLMSFMDSPQPWKHLSDKYTWRKDKLLLGAHLTLMMGLVYFAVGR